VTALVDPHTSNAARLADELFDGSERPAVFGDLAAALGGAPIELVTVTTPSGVHVGTAVEALGADRHVLVEKPLDVRLAGALELDRAAAAAASRGIVAGAVSQHRFDPPSRVVQAAISEGRFGRVNSAVASVPWWRSQAYYDSAQWRGTWTMDGGGALMNQGIHTLDLLVWFLGTPVEVSARIARLAHTGIEVEDIVVATVAFESGALAVLHATTAAHPGLPTRIQVMGDRGSAVIEHDQLSYFYEAGRDPLEVGAFGIDGARNQRDAVLDPAENVPQPDPTDSAVGHARQYADLFAAIRDRSQPLVTVSDAIRSLATAHAIYIAATVGRPVAVHDVLGGDYSDLAYEVQKRA
jgi:predicted dehydrogenase